MVTIRASSASPASSPLYFAVLTPAFGWPKLASMSNSAAGSRRATRCSVLLFLSSICLDNLEN